LPAIRAFRHDAHGEPRRSMLHVDARSKLLPQRTWTHVIRQELFGRPLETLCVPQTQEVWMTGTAARRESLECGAAFVGKASWRDLSPAGRGYRRETP